MKRTFSVIIIIALTFAYAETLFEVKDASNNKVLDVSTDGLRVMNAGDTLMVISSAEIKAVLSNNKGLSRTFSVTTASSKGSENDLMRLTSDSTRFWISDEGSGFGISSHTSSKEKSVTTDFLKVSSEKTQMREGSSGERYTDFSPENMFLGLNAGKTNYVNGIYGNNNVYLGNYSGYSNYSGRENVFIGANSGFTNYSGRQNIFIGLDAGYKNYSGYGSTMIGYQAGYNSTASINVFIGNGAGYTNTNAGFNTYIGNSAGYYQGSGSENVYLGNACGMYKNGGSYNTIIGTGAGMSNQAGAGNIFLGYYAGANDTGSNRLYIDNSSTQWPLLYGQFTGTRMLVIDGNTADNPNNRKLFVYGSAGGTTAWYNDSDKRLKTNIKTIDSAMDKVIKLRGVSFDWNGGERYQKGSSIGFIAQEAIEVVPELVDHNSENDSYGMQYAPVTALLVEAFKEQKKENDELKIKVQDQDERIRLLENAILKLNKK